MCVLLSTVYLQANGCAKLNYVDICDTGGNSKLFFIYLYKYINWSFLSLERGIIPLISKISVV